ncbi:MAG: MotA/TolQ/ExbB proton channel family protein [Gammaproteobacteria bacterium]
MESIKPMKHLVAGIFVTGILFALPVAGANAQSSGSGAQAKSLQQLLNQVQADLHHQTAQDQARLKKFIQARDQQQALVKEAQQKLAAAQARSKKLQGEFSDNGKKLDKLSTTLSNREGNLGQVFGIVRQTAGQFKGSLTNSIISAQYPDRSVFATKLASSKSLPSIRSLETLWYDMLLQMTAQGRVVKFSADVTLPNGNTVHRPVVRIGDFNAVMGNKYLEYAPASNALVVIPSQPAGRFTGSAGNLYNATGNKLVQFGIDPERGGLLALFIQKPSFRQELDYGGAIGYTILVLFLIALLVCLERGIYLGIVGFKMKRQLKSGTPSTNNPLGRVLSVYDQNRRDDVETLTLRLDEAIMKEVPALEARQNFIKLIAAVGPLLGLLGTVVGMVQTFTAITLFGTGNPKIMAAGISEALVTTVEGLVTAIPLTILYSFINARSRNLVHILEEQSAGILAAQAEKEAKGGSPGGGTPPSSRRPVRPGERNAPASDRQPGQQGDQGMPPPKKA